MRGSPYSTARWQKIRRFVIARDPYCTIRGPRCTGISTTAHHVLPSSTHPHLFFDLGNLAGACAPCNSGGGARIAVDNRAARATVAQLEWIVERQQDLIEELTRRLGEREHPKSRSVAAIR